MVPQAPESGPQEGRAQLRVSRSTSDPLCFQESCIKFLELEQWLLQSELRVPNQPTPVSVIAHPGSGICLTGVFVSIYSNSSDCKKVRFDAESFIPTYIFTDFYLFFLIDFYFLQLCLSYRLFLIFYRFLSSTDFLFSYRFLVRASCSLQHLLSRVLFFWLP